MTNKRKIKIAATPAVASTPAGAASASSVGQVGFGRTKPIVRRGRQEWFS